MGTYKSHAVVCSGFCFLVCVTSGARSGSTYELPGPSTAFFRGNDLHSWCQRDKSWAMAYTAGMWDLSSISVLRIQGLTSLPFERDANPAQERYHDARVDLALDQFGRFCEPDHVTVEQVTDIFCAFLRDVPDRRSEPATSLFRDAMKKAWPCKKQ